MKRRQFVLTLAASMLSGLLSSAAYAKDWPERPLRLVVPFPTGGATDIIARVIAQQAGKELGQAIMVDNKTGAAGTIGTADASRAKADGYTLLMATNSTQAIAPHLYRKLSYHPTQDLTPILHLGDAGNVLLINPELPVNTLTELIDYAKQHPGEMNYASSGAGTVVHLNTELFMHQAGIEMSHVPYRGTAQAISDIVSGNVHVLIDSIPSGLPYMRNGQLRALATTGHERSPLAPKLPTFMEAGLPDYASVTWFGLYAPTGVDQAILDQVYTAFEASIQHPDVRRQLETLGVTEPRSRTRQEFIELVQHDSDQWKQVIHQANVPIQ